VPIGQGVEQGCTSGGVVDRDDEALTVTARDLDGLAPAAASIVRP